MRFLDERFGRVEVENVEDFENSTKGKHDMTIRIYGTGCSKCQQLAEAVKNVALRVKGVVAIEKVTAIEKIVARGVVATPALEVEDEIVATGRIPNEAELAHFLGVDETAPCSCGCGCNCGSGKGTGKNRLRTWLGRALLAFAVGALGVGIARQQGRTSDLCCSAVARVPAAGATTVAQADVTSPVVKVYYFHGTNRCRTCNRIEELSRSVVQEKYGAQMAAGDLVFESVNIDESQHEHFVNDFQLTMRTVVVAKGDRYERLDKVWQLVRDEAAFRDYVTRKVGEFF